MERFIQIALDIVVGDGAEVQNRLRNLSELCEKFYPLLYQLDVTASTQDNSKFLPVLMQTWESLKFCEDPLTLMAS